MTGNDPTILIVSALTFLGLGVGFVLITVRLQRSRIGALEARAREQALGLEAAQASRMILWAEEPDGSLYTPPSPFREEAFPGLGDHIKDLEALISALPADECLRLGEAIEIARAGEPRPPTRARLASETLTEWSFSTTGGRLQGVIRDITAEVRMQDQLIQSQRREAVATLVAGISHEFGNVLSAVDSCSQALLLQELGPDARKAGELIQGSAQRGKVIIRQLLDLGRPRATEARQVDVNEVLRDLARLLEPLIPKQIRIVLDLAEAPPRPTLDRAQLHQALLNLCLNARDAMPQGGTLTLSSRMDEGSLVLEVSDTGHGMDEATQARIFEPFFTTKEPGLGTGLGLSITREIVTGMGGELSCKSAPEQGTRFQIQLTVSGPPSITG